MKSHILIALCWLFAASSLLSAATPIRRGPTPPDQDPFYQPPKGYESKNPGAILKSRKVDAALFGFDHLNGVEAWQLLYRTNSISDDTPMATVTTIFKPSGASKDKLVAYATAEDSNAWKCAPSYAYQKGSNQESLIASVEVLAMEAHLSEGWVVTSPDHEGPDSAFVAGRLAGHAILDAIRATLAFNDLGLSKNTKVAGTVGFNTWACVETLGVFAGTYTDFFCGYHQKGYSGGAIAMGWTAALQPTYAKELNIVGWAHGGTPANLSGTVEYIDGTSFAGFAVAGVQGLMSAYPSLTKYANSVLTDEGKKALEFTKENCGPADIVRFSGQTFLSKKYMTVGDQLLREPEVKKVTDAHVMGMNKDETPTAPLFIYHAKNDEIIPIKDIEATVDRYCDNGADVEFVRDLGSISEHAIEEIIGLPDVINWFSDRFDGKPLKQKGCNKRDVHYALFDPGAFGKTLQIILQDLLSIFGARIGNNDSKMKSSIKSGKAP